MIRILFTSVGRRVELIQAFRDAALCTDTSLKIYGADMDMTAPALAWCDERRKVCAIRDEEYISLLLEICRHDQIDLLIPTIDTDLMKLANARQDFEAQGTKVLIADPDKVALCRDKRLTGAFFESCGAKAPRTFGDWKEYPGPYPCFIKPKDGSSSIDAYRADTREELMQLAGRIDDYIVQPYVSGCEYTIDVFCDYEGSVISIVPRERLAVRAGEVLKTRIAMDSGMIDKARSIANRFHPRGPMTIQLIRESKTGEDWFIEINPRFGGGAPLSMKAGAQSAENALAIAKGKGLRTLNAGRIAEGATYSRFDQSVRTDTPQDITGARGVIFDLDDTLFLERDYVRSGFRAIARYLNDPNAEDELWMYFLQGLPAIDSYVEGHRCLEKKAEILEVYRWHKPELSLDDVTRDALVSLRDKGYKLGIITDGRPEGQRAKLDALRLWDLVDDVIVTDELGGPQFRKPCDIAFRILQRKWCVPIEEIVYIGDNPTKDFQAPQQLGMKTVHLKRKTALYATGWDSSNDVVSISSIRDLLDVVEL